MAAWLRAVLLVHRGGAGGFVGGLVGGSGGLIDDVFELMCALRRGQLSPILRGVCKEWRAILDAELRAVDVKVALRVELGRFLSDFLRLGSTHRFSIGPSAAKIRHGLMIRRRAEHGVQAVVVSRRSERGIKMWSATRQPEPLPSWEIRLGCGVEVLVSKESIGVYFNGALLHERGVQFSMKHINVQFLACETVVIHHIPDQTEHRLSVRVASGR